MMAGFSLLPAVKDSGGIFASANLRTTNKQDNNNNNNNNRFV